MVHWRWNLHNVDSSTFLQELCQVQVQDTRDGTLSDMYHRELFHHLVDTLRSSPDGPSVHQSQFTVTITDQSHHTESHTSTNHSLTLQSTTNHS